MANDRKEFLGSEEMSIMKIWVLTILMVRGKLGEFAQMIDERVEKLSLDMVSLTSELYDKIIFWNDVKRRVVNAKVLAERVLHILDEDESKICLLYAKGMSMQEISDAQNISKSSVSRKITSSAQKGASVLNSLGFNKEKLEEDYSDIEIIARTFKKLSRILGSDTVNKLSRYKSARAKINIMAV